MTDVLEPYGMASIIISSYPNNLRERERERAMYYEVMVHMLKVKQCNARQGKAMQGGREGEDRTSWR